MVHESWKLMGFPGSFPLFFTQWQLAKALLSRAPQLIRGQPGPMLSGGISASLIRRFLGEGIPISGKILKVYKSILTDVFVWQFHVTIVLFFSTGTRNGRHTLLIITACVCWSGYSCMTNRNCRQLMEVKAAINIINSIIIHLHTLLELLDFLLRAAMDLDS